MGYGDESGISTGSAVDRQAAASSTLGALQDVADVAAAAPGTLRESQAQSNALRAAQFARQQAAATPGMSATGGGFAGIGTTQLGMLREQSAQSALDAQSVLAADIAAEQAQADVVVQGADIAFAEQATRANTVQQISTTLASMQVAGQRPSMIGAEIGNMIGTSLNLKNPEDLQAAARIGMEFAAFANVDSPSEANLRDLLVLVGPSALAKIGEAGGWNYYFEHDPDAAIAGTYRLKSQHYPATSPAPYTSIPHQKAFHEGGPI
jgi:hypothetical protein